MRLEAAVPLTALAAMRAPFEAVDATRLNAPIAQPLSLFLDLAGEALRERLFIVLGPGGEDFCLRPDFTLAALQAHAATGDSTGRYSYEGPAFRVSPAGAERAEQFLQIGLERFEPGDAASADAAMAALAWRSAAAGGRHDLGLLIGDVALYGAFLDAIDVPAPRAARLQRAMAGPDGRQAPRGPVPDAPPARNLLAGLLAGLPRTDAEAVLAEIWSLAGIEPVGGRSAGEIVHRLTDRAALAAGPALLASQETMIERFLAIADTPAEALKAVAALAGGAGGALRGALADWERRLAALEADGPPVERMRLSTAFGRSFGYYDGVLFEVRSEALSADQPVAAGGRYDSLPARLGTPLPTGAVGCMVRPGRAWREGRP